MDKQELRRQLRLAKSQISIEDKLLQSRHVFSYIENLDVFKQANNVLMYYALPDELPTKEYIIKWSTIKTVILPKVSGSNLALFNYNSENIEYGSFGIIEPTEICNKRNISDVDIAIIPGMAFDLGGHRLGRGKGFYDRLLSGASNIVKIGVALDCQILESVPYEKNDINMDLVISNSIIYNPE